MVTQYFFFFVLLPEFHRIKDLYSTSPISLGKCNVCIVDLPTEFILLAVSLCLGSFIQVYNVIDPTSSVYFDLQPRGHVTQCYCCLGPSDEIRPVVSG